MPTVRLTKTSVLVAEREQKRTRPLLTKVSVLVGRREQKRTLPRLTKTSVLVAEAATTTTVDYIHVTSHYDEIVYEPSRPEVRATSHYLEAIYEPERPELRTTSHYLEVVWHVTTTTTSTTTTSTTTTTAPPGTGTVVFGHHTAVEEENDKDFTGEWSGSADIFGSGDSEYLRFHAGQSKVLNLPWQIGTGLVKLQINKYNTGDNVSIYYKEGDTYSNCESDSWKKYSSNFSCQGWVQVRLIQGSTTTTTTSSTTTTSTTTTTVTTTTTIPFFEVWSYEDAYGPYSWSIIASFRNYRIPLGSANLSNGGAGGQIRILLKGPPAGTAITIGGASIGERSGSTDDYSSAPTRITFDGGSNTTTVSVGVDKYSDWVDYDLDDSKNQLVHFLVTAGSTAYTDTGNAYRIDSTTDYTMTQTVSFSGTSYHYILDAVEIRGASPFTTTTTV